ncbi:MAG: PQQ-binding-like beta-propeller repeat protein [Bacteroidales bacterium]|nr:PQQ-binding-like beta-propeller repeat protein [Bacteroidales bacterium]
MRAILLSALFLLNTVIYTQDYEPDRVNLYVTVTNSNNQPIPFIEITLIAKDDKQQLKGVTDNKGKFQFIAKLGKTYVVNFKDKQNHSEIIIPTKYVGTMVKTIKYDPPANTNLNTKSNIPDTIKQTFSSGERPSESEILIMLEIYNDKDLPLKNYQVRLFCKKINKVYVSKTNEKGTAFFIVPFNNNYDVGLDDINKVVSINVLADRPGLTYFEHLSYVPTVVEETRKNDTIRQVLPENAGPTNARIFVHLLVTDLDSKPLPNEKIYLNVVEENTVYTTTTSNNGYASFLVPKYKKYKLSFLYERDVDLLDYSKSEPYSLHTTEIEYQYMGSAKIEEHYKTAKRDAKGFKTEFMEVKIKPVPFDKKIKKTKDGFDIEFDSTAITNSPAVYKNKMFMSEGYYSRDFYGFDSKTGRNIWGVELAESGASSAVCDSDIVLINTESCTLYAIDINSGRLLWSKWLGPYIYSTPSVADGKVFTVYPNDLFVYSSEEKIVNEFVLVSFDLKTGKTVWQNWLDAEVLACPVIAAGKVYVTTMSGRLYQFDENTGNMLNTNVAYALTPPTVAAGKIFVIVRDKPNSMNKVMAIYDEKTLKLKKQVPEIRGKIIYEKMSGESASTTMKFNDSRPVYYNGRNYNVVGNRLICSSPEDGSIIWSVMFYDPTKVVAENTNSTIMPVIAGGKLIVASPNGEIQIYNPADGKLIKSFATNANFCTEPVVNDGWIYIGNKNGKLISINTLDKTITGWSMWGLNARHNAVVR